jgi:hypothetical protein
MHAEQRPCPRQHEEEVRSYCREGHEQHTGGHPSGPSRHEARAVKAVKCFP